MTATLPILSLAEMKQHLRVEDDFANTDIMAKIGAARRHVEAYVGPLGAFASTGGVPEDLVEAIKLLAAHLYENRETTISGTIINEIPLGFHDLIGPYRKWEF